MAGTILCRPRQASAQNLGKRRFRGARHVSRKSNLCVCVCARATLLWFCACRVALVVARCVSKWLAQPSPNFVHVGSLSLRRGANFDIARATFLALCAGRMKWLAQPSWHFVHVGSLTAWRGAYFSCFSESLVKRSHEFFGRSFYDDLARVSWCRLRGP